MAKAPRFNIEDVERLFRALVPSGTPDPFGRIEELVLSLAEEHAKDGILTDKFRAEIREELDDIKSRTFGILFLQIFRTLKFFMGLLPQGRIILIIVAGIGLLTTLLQDGSLSGEAIREAVAKTGLSKFIDKLLAELTAFVNEIANHVEELANQTSEVFVSVAGNLDQSLATLVQIASDLVPVQEETLSETQQRASTAANRIALEVDRMAPTSNLAANGADLLGPALRDLDNRIRVIPTMALKLVRL